MSANGSWPLVPLRELCVDGGQYGTSEKSSIQPTGLPVLRMGNLVDGEIDWSNLKYLEASSGEALKCSLQKGDLLFNRTNSVELVGKSAVFNGEREAVFASYLVRFRMKADRADPHFVCAYINSEFGRAFINANMVRAIGQANVSASVMQRMQIPAPPVHEQRQVADRLREQQATLKETREALESQLANYSAFRAAVLRESVSTSDVRTIPVREGLQEVTEGIGVAWRDSPVLGATRAGLAPAKEPVGKQPHRYKPVRSGTIFYNPMRILLGSIAIVDEDDAEGITSPDYVVMRGVEGVLHPVWFYHWFRSSFGAEFIKSLTRGAVRERLLFNRLAKGSVPVPEWNQQLAAVAALREIKVAERAVTARLAQLEKLPAKLLRAAFEPASTAERQAP